MNTRKNKKHNKNKTQKKRKIDLSKLQLTIAEKNKLCPNFDNPDLMVFEEEIPELYKKKLKVDIESPKLDLDKLSYKYFKDAITHSKIKPQNDFYSYINERWLKNFQVKENQKYIVQVDDFRLVQDKVYHQLIDIVKDYISQNNTKFSKCLKNFYKSSIHHQITIAQLKEYAEQTLNEIDEIRLDKNNLWKLLGFLNECEIINWGSPFVWYLSPNDKKPDTFRCYIDGPQLSLADLSVYYDDDEDKKYKQNYKKQYLKYLKNVFEKSFGKNNKFNVEDIFNCEVKLYNAFDCTKIKNEDPNNYNLVLNT
jgi:predicted metalloendopeptidase